MRLDTTYERDNYPIIVENGALNHLKSYVESYHTVILCVDDTVQASWSDKITSIAEETGARLKVLHSGESLKYLKHYETFVEGLLKEGVTRNTCLVAIGGGATGDFVGFVAATLLRGVDFIQVPTTILAHDSSVGGKVGINTKAGKNLIGAFHRPEAVLYDLDFLTTLPYSEILSGYGEVFKHALLNNVDQVNALMKAYPNQAQLKALHDMEKYLVLGIVTKLKIVVADEKESGLRKHLNLGHTFGHAFEYLYHIPHGQAILVGILYQMILSNEHLQANFDIQKYYQYLRRLDVPFQEMEQVNFEPIYKLMLKDKKNTQAGVQMVLLKDYGEPITMTVEKLALKSAFLKLQSLIKEV
ncbi:3-dehydroquinate synthase [Staphylococcus massiliensis]|uniref:3-dehydroquinate synthase n=1 Tax=Staphylococcus massiliensis TaxID=555791 RepID=UPI001EE0F4A5|nr:3-dehydroquinate synthase [Staphylococcus massiliensis]MCG3412234.1 3-dehydroquinate synthase [Staphylococcus massiliensis]